MATTRTSNSRTVGWLFVASGVLYLLALLLGAVGHVGKLGTWLEFFAYALLAVAFVILFLWRSLDILLRVALIVAAVGWALVALNELPGVNIIPFLGEILALAGTLVSGIVIFVRHIFTRRAAAAFLVLAIIAALDLLILLTGVLGVLATILSILFGVILVVVGVLIARKY